MLLKNHGSDSIKIDEQWKQQQYKVVAIAAAVVGEAKMAAYLRTKGLTPAGVLLPVVAGRLGVEAAGHLFAAMINGESGVLDWQIASSTMFDWYGLEDTTLGMPLNLIPNPLGVVEVVFESGTKIGDATVGTFDTVRRQITSPVKAFLIDLLETGTGRSW